jgi:hypothetical protein
MYIAAGEYEVAADQKAGRPSVFEAPLALHLTSVVTVITNCRLPPLRHIPTKIEPKPVVALGGGGG